MLRTTIPRRRIVISADTTNLVQRYYSSGLGRFLTPDPYMATMNSANNPSDPGSWNRYAYVQGDPVGSYDPSGQNRADPDGGFGSCGPSDMWAGTQCRGGGGGGSQVTQEQLTQYLLNTIVPALVAGGMTTEQAYSYVASTCGSCPIPLSQVPWGAIWDDIRTWGGVVIGVVEIITDPLHSRIRGHQDPSQVQALPKTASGVRDSNGDCIPPGADQKGPAGLTYKWQQIDRGSSANPNDPPHWHWTQWDFNISNCMWSYRGRGESRDPNGDPGPGYVLILGIF